MHNANKSPWPVVFAGLLASAIVAAIIECAGRFA